MHYQRTLNHVQTTFFLLQIPAPSLPTTQQRPLCDYTTAILIFVWPCSFIRPAALGLLMCLQLPAPRTPAKVIKEIKPWPHQCLVTWTSTPTGCWHGWWPQVHFCFIGRLLKIKQSCCVYRNYAVVTHVIAKKNKTLGRAQDPRANGAWLSKLTEHDVFILGQTIRKQEGMVERLGEMRKGRRERIEKGSREGIEKETKRQFEEKEGRETPLIRISRSDPAM